MANRLSQCPDESAGNFSEVASAVAVWPVFLIAGVFLPKGKFLSVRACSAAALKEDR